MLKDQLTSQQWFAIAIQKSAEGIVGGNLTTEGRNKSGWKQRIKDSTNRIWQAVNTVLTLWGMNRVNQEVKLRPLNVNLYQT